MNSQVPAFASVKLKSNSRPADYDGKVANLNAKNTDEGKSDPKQFDAPQLKKVGRDYNR